MYHLSLAFTLLAETRPGAGLRPGAYALFVSLEGDPIGETEVEEVALRAEGGEHTFSARVRVPYNFTLVGQTLEIALRTPHGTAQKTLAVVCVDVPAIATAAFRTLTKALQPGTLLRLEASDDSLYSAIVDITAGSTLRPRERAGYKYKHRSYVLCVESGGKTLAMARAIPRSVPARFPTVSVPHRLLLEDDVHVVVAARKSHALQALRRALLPVDDIVALHVATLRERERAIEEAAPRPATSYEEAPPVQIPRFAEIRRTLELAVPHVAHAEEKPPRLSLTLQERSEVTFLDYLKAGVELRLVVGVDLAGMRRCTLSASALNAIRDDMQRMTERTDPAAAVISTLGSILGSYDTDQLFPLYLLGAGPPHAAPSDFIRMTSEVGSAGLSSLLDTLAECERTFTQPRPSALAPLIREISAKASLAAAEEPESLVYTVLLLVTDGSYTDERAVKDALVASAHLPLHNLICAVDPAKAARVLTLDVASPSELVSSTGVPAAFDNVHVVDFTRSAESGVLCRDALNELPAAIVQYYLRKGVTPELALATKRARHAVSLEEEARTAALAEIGIAAVVEAKECDVYEREVPDFLAEAWREIVDAHAPTA